jgi:hypothetical protein
MNNSIDAHLEFSFKGETYSLSSTLDLDRLLENSDALPSLHALLAAQHGIDTYSYQYEVMLEEPIRFDNARGMAADFVNGEDFDAAAYAAAWRNHRLLAPLQEIAKNEMGIDDLNRHPQLKNALMQAYHLGLRRNS